MKVGPMRLLFGERAASPVMAEVTAPGTVAAVREFAQEAGVGNHRRDRLLSSLVLLFAVALALGGPFALRAGEAVFLPVVTALVVAIILVPLVEWFRKRGLGAGPASLLSVVTFAAGANAVLVSIVIPATAWVQLLPSRVDQIRANLRPLLGTYSVVRKLMAQANAALGSEDQLGAAAAAVPALVLGFVTSAPLALFQLLFTLLLAFFFLTAYAERRDAGMVASTRAGTRNLIEMAQLGRDIVRATAAYFFTIASVNLALGAVTTLVAWGFGLPSPLMWGGFAALFNFIPYVGPIVVVGLLLVGGLVTFAEPLNALWPALIFLAMHLAEANVVTPALVGRRLTISPLAILLGLSFWGWVWGVVGALISVPLLIVFKVFFEHVGTPNLLGFLFNDGTLMPDTPPGGAPALALDTLGTDA